MIPALLRTAVSMRCAKRSTGPFLNANNTRQSPTTQVLAHGWRCFRNTAAGLHRHPHHPGYLKSNLGNVSSPDQWQQYGPNQVGLHYQIHRSIGFHHAAALRKE